MTPRRRIPPILLILLAGGLSGGPVSAPATAQPGITNPVYVDDSPAAAQVLAEVDALVAQDNAGEAVRALQRLLDTEPDRLVPDAADSDLFRPVRTLAHRALLDRPELLERYRLTADPLAARLLEQGETERVERAMLLTRAGFDAALRTARGHLEAAAFDAASRTLAQLDRHPVRTGEDGARAAELQALVARYSRRADDRERAQRWAQDAGVTLAAEALEAITPPTAALRAGYGSFEPMDAARVDRLLPRPLRSVMLDPRGEQAGATAGATGPTPWVLPSVAGDLLLINDGQRVAAFDAASLERRWTYEADIEGLQGLDIDRNRRAFSAMQDTQTVSAGGGVVLAVTGDAVGRRRVGDPRLHALTIDTGELLWNARPAGIHPDLAGASIFGPPVVSGETAVVGFFTFSPLRRVHVAHLAGLDLYTGRTRWLQLIGTAGVLPSQRGVEVAPAMLLHRGVVYRCEPLGVIAAVEAASGRPLWTRRVPVTGEEPPARDAWEQPVPVAVGDAVLTFSPDGTRLLRLHAESGAITASRRLSELNWPDYLLRAGDRLVTISNTQVQTLPLDEAMTARPEPIPLNGAPIMGRAIVSGQLVLIPTERGVLAVDPVERRVRTVPLEHGGSPAVAQGQLLVFGSGTVHGYLDWTTAERVLSRRIAEHPADPQHAIALAELASRADRPERIAGAADAALAAVERMPDPAAAERARARLFGALSAILDGDRPISTRERGEIVDRLGLAARTADERVGHLMHRGRWLEERGDFRDAAATYQEILLDPGLARAGHALSWRRQRADLAATAALASLVEREGTAVYRAFDREADAALRAVGDPAADAPASRQLAQQYEAIARAYPLARTTPDAWLAAAGAHRDAGDERQALAALHAGFDAAARVPTRRVNAATLAEITGRLATRLADDDRAFEATSVLRRARTEQGGLRLTRFGEPIDADALEERLLRALAEHDRLPRLAATPERMSQVLPGWTIVPPASRSGPRTPSHVMLRSETHGVVALWSLAGRPAGDLGFELTDAERAELEAGEGLRPLWSRPLGEAPIDEPRLIQLTPARALLYRRAHAEAAVEAIDTVSGETLWVSPRFGDLFETDPPRYATGVIETPLDGRAWLRDQIIAIDDDFLALVERTGRAILLDLDTGGVVWATQLDVPAVYEASLRDGVLTLIGERPADPARGEGPGVLPIAAGYDIPSRTTVFGPRELRSFARWVRHEPAGPVLIGLDSGVLAVDPSRGEELWTVDDPAVRLSGDAWTMRDRAYIMGADRQLWQIDLTSGTLRPEALEDLGRVGDADRIHAERLPSGEALFVSTEGMVVFDRTGRLIGGDGFDRTRSFLLPATADGLVVAVDARGPTDPTEQFDESNGTPFGFVAMDSRTGRIRAEASLLLHALPLRTALLDDLIVLGLADATVVYRAPRTGPPAEDR
ncbi:MAG: outer membrane protein assembly factor BamB family protein [Phycisphaerales bacterium]